MKPIDRFNKSQQAIVDSCPKHETTQIAVLQKFITDQTATLATTKVMCEQYRQLSVTRESVLREAITAIEDYDQLLHTKEKELEEAKKEIARLNLQPPKKLLETRDSVVNAILVGRSLPTEIESKLNTLPFDISALARFVTRAQLSSPNANKINGYLDRNPELTYDFRYVANLTQDERIDLFDRTIDFILDDLQICPKK